MTTQTTTTATSKYLTFFKENGGWIRENSDLIGDILLVEKLKFETKTASGLLIPKTANQLNTLTSDEPNFYRVLLVGAGFYDDTTGADVPLDIVPGDIILTGAVSVRMFSTFPKLQTAETDVLGITRHSDIQWRWKGEAAFDSFLDQFNAAIKTVFP